MTTSARNGYSRVDVLQAFTAAGLQRGDTVFVTTSLGMLGVPDGIDSADDLNRLFFEALKECLGETGTIIVPTYSYTFGRSTATEPQVYDPDVTPAAIGPFPEFFRRQPGVIRSLDPMMSVAGYGPAAASLFRDLPRTSYGADSVFARLAQMPAKCCSIGLGPNWMPFIHHTDWLSRVPFRYDKLFRGIIRTAGRDLPVCWLYSVAMLHPASHSTGHKVARRAVEAGIWQFAPLGRARVYVADYRRYFDFTLDRLKEDRWMTADGPPGDPLTLERERVPVEPSVEFDATGLSTDDIFLRSASFHRTDVCDASNHLLRCLSDREGLQISIFESGGNHFDWVIPERWVPHTASLNDEQGKPLFDSAFLTSRLYGYSLSVDHTVTKAELLPHVSLCEDNDRLARYRNTVLNRDWGLCLSRREFADIPDQPLHLIIKTGFAYGRMITAFSPYSSLGGMSLLIIGYVCGPAGGFDLLSAHSALTVWRLLRDTASPQRLFHVSLLLISSPAGFAAWLDRHPHLRPIIAGVIEIRRPDREAAFEPRFFGTTDKFGLARHWRHQLQISAETASLDRRPFLLTPGENPVALQQVPFDEFPVISVGAPLAAECDAGGRSDPFTPLTRDDLTRSVAQAEQIALLLKSFKPG